MIKSLKVNCVSLPSQDTINSTIYIGYSAHTTSTSIIDPIDTLRRIQEVASHIRQMNSCSHRWVHAETEFDKKRLAMEDGEFCPKCNAIRLY